MARSEIRPDYRVILDMIEPESRVMDLGCGGGGLLDLLAREKNVAGQGVEIDADNINVCVSKGLSVIQADVDEGLVDYRDASFDYVILNQTLQVVKAPETVLSAMVRVGKMGIVGFPNYGHWSTRLYLLITGRAPIISEEGFTWYTTPDIHPFTVRDFEGLCEKQGIEVIERRFIAGDDMMPGWLPPNLFAKQAVYLLARKNA